MEGLHSWCHVKFPVHMALGHKEAFCTFSAASFQPSWQPNPCRNWSEAFLCSLLRALRQGLPAKHRFSARPPLSPEPLKNNPKPSSAEADICYIALGGRIPGRGSAGCWFTRHRDCGVDWETEILQTIRCKSVGFGALWVTMLIQRSLSQPSATHVRPTLFPCGWPSDSLPPRRSA